MPAMLIFKNNVTPKMTGNHYVQAGYCRCIFEGDNS